MDAIGANYSIHLLSLAIFEMQRNTNCAWSPCFSLCLLAISPFACIRLWWAITGNKALFCIMQQSFIPLHSSWLQQ